MWTWRIYIYLKRLTRINLYLKRSIRPFSVGTYLLVGVFVSLQGLHDGELCVVFEPPRLLAENLLQHPQSQGSDHMLGELQRFKVWRKITRLQAYLQCYRRKECFYLSVAHCLQQEQQDGLEMFIPHLQGVFTNQLQQLAQRSLPLLNALVVIGQLFQQLGHQFRLVQIAIC